MAAFTDAIGPTGPRNPAPWRRGVSFALFLLLAALTPLLAATPATAQEKFVKIDKLTDVDFLTITNITADAVRAQNLCVYSAKTTIGYNVRASGSGAGGSFRLANGPFTLGYEVQWSDRSGQTSGVQLQPNVVRSGLTTNASQQGCQNGPPTSASLIIILRSAALQAAAVGSYSGVLTVTIGAE